MQTAMWQKGMADMEPCPPKTMLYYWQ